MCKLQEVPSPLFFFANQRPFSATNLIVIESNLHTINHLPVTQVCLEGGMAKSLARCLFLIITYQLSAKRLLCCVENPKCEEKKKHYLAHKNKIGAYHRCLWIYTGRPGRQKKGHGDLETPSIQQKGEKRGGLPCFCRHENSFVFTVKTCKA